MRRLALALLVGLVACAASPSPVVPTPQVYVPYVSQVTLTIDGSLATARTPEPTDRLCISTLDVPSPVTPPGAFTTVCRSARAWVTLIEAHQ